MSGLRVNIGKLNLQNPVMAASGTFGYADEFAGFINLKKLGAIVTKTITLNPRKGNPPPRTCESPCGMLNSIGLENPGVEVFLKEKLGYLKKTGVPLIVSIGSQSGAGEFVELTRRLDRIKEIAALELNISCPNIINHKLISQDAKATFKAVKAIRKATNKTLITKLSPNVTDIVDIAIAAKQGGSDAVSLINTLIGMSVNVNTQRPRLAAGAGGLSGPAIRPVAVRMVWEVYKKVDLPIIGMGGITDTESALELMIAGATAVSVGTANFINPKVTVEIIQGLKQHMLKNKIKSIKQITGSIRI